MLGIMDVGTAGERYAEIGRCEGRSYGDASEELLWGVDPFLFHVCQQLQTHIHNTRPVPHEPITTRKKRESLDIFEIHYWYGTKIQRGKKRRGLAVDQKS